MADLPEIRKALFKLPNPVAVLAVNDDGELNGMIASWITQVSFDPPRILIAIHPSRYTHQMLHSAGNFTLNLLAEGQEDRVSQFKLKGGARMSKFSGLQMVEGRNNQPYLPDSAAVFHCRLVDVIEGGDHTMFIGEVLEALDSDRTPLSTTSLGKGYTGQA